MPALPIVERELRVQARRRSTYWTRLLAAGIAALFILWLLFIEAVRLPMTSQGKAMFTVLSHLAFVYCLFAGALAAADCLSTEKREGTLGLLFLTPLRGYDIVAGKFVSASLHTIYGLIGIVPMLAVAVLFGGVSGLEIIQTSAVLGNTLFLSLAAGVILSSLCRQERTAVSGAFLLILVVTMGPYALGYYLADNFGSGTAYGIIDGVVGASPVHAFRLVQWQRPVLMAQPSVLWNSLGQTHAIAWILLGLACLIVPAISRDCPPSRPRERWSTWWRTRLQGGGSRRFATRRRLLDRNPAMWLSSREASKRIAPWVLVLAMAAIGFWIYAKFEFFFSEWFFVILLITQLLLKLWLAGEVCTRWMEDRRTGALELLLCTPQRVSKLIRGQSLALWRQFGGPTLVALALTSTLWLVLASGMGGGQSGSTWRTWLLLSIPVFFADLAALRWVGMWNALTQSNLNKAISATVSRVLILRWLLYGLLALSSRTLTWIGIGNLEFFQSPWCCLVIALSLDLWFIRSARRKVLSQLRTLAAMPIGMPPPEPVEPAPAPISPKNGSAIRRLRRLLWPRSVRGRLAVAGCGLFLLMLAVLNGFRFAAQVQLNGRLDALRKTGAPTTMTELAALQPVLPPGEINAAEVLERVFPLVNMSLLWQHQPLLDRVALQQLTALPSDALALIQTTLASVAPASKILHEPPSLKHGRYARDWNTGGIRFNNQWQGLTLAGPLLQLEILLHGETNNVPEAVASLHRLLDLTESLCGESASAYLGFRNQMLTRASASAEWLLRRHPLSEPDLERLQSRVSGLAECPDLPAMLVAWRCGASEWHRTSRSILFPAGMRSGFGQVLGAALLQHFRRWTGADSRDLIRFLNELEKFGAIVRESLPDQCARLQRFRSTPDAALQYVPGGNLFLPSLLYEHLLSPNLEFVARCRVLLTGLAVAGFRVVHDRLPTALSELVPEFLAHIPQDPYDGQPLRFETLPDGARLYSIGIEGLRFTVGVGNGQ